MSPVDEAAAVSFHPSPHQARLCARIYGEFREMPGLTLSIPQASRLFNMENGEITRLLNMLVDARLLRTDGRVYALAGTGRLRA